MLASVICNSPIALITLMDYDVQLIKANVGVDADEMPRSTLFCTHGTCPKLKPYKRTGI